MVERASAHNQRPAVRTFLIADIRGYTRFTRESGDEAASRLASGFAEICREGVEAWGGTLLELRGDEALALFDSPRKALRCAVELQAAFAAETDAEPELPLRVGIGLDAGEAVAVGDGYRGAALNLAARLCSAAGPSQVIASEGLIHLSGTVPGLAFSRLAPTELKGFDGSVAALLVASESASAPWPGHEPGRPLAPLPAQLDPIVPLVGREDEMRWLSWHWRRARHGDGRAVVLAGLPGIGKTRTSAELATSVHARGARIVYLPAGRGIGDVDVDRQVAHGAALLVVDDLDAAPSATAESVAALAGQIHGRPMLLLVTHREEAAPALVRIVEGFTSPEGRRQLAPLEPEAVRSIAALYAGQVGESLPIDEIMRESGGVPAAIHRLVSGWARDSAAGRLGRFAEQTSAGRRGLRAAEQGLMSSVEALELARERAALYGANADDAPDETIAGARVEVCPYKGLAAFEAADSEYFFGRERHVAELVAKLVGSPFLGVVGASGSGKSSAIRAGLQPALAGGVLPGSDRWPQALLRPGEHPLTELGRALAAALPDAGLPTDDPAAALGRSLDGLAPDQRLVLVVDQFEEVFNATRDEVARQAFVDLLTAERRGLKVVVAMRADHYGHCAPYPELARLIGASQVLVGPLSRAELAAVIERPAQRVGLRVEPGLTETLLDDLGDEPGSLPLLSTALLELWQTRDHGRLTLAAYHASGGVRGAVARLAEAAYARLGAERQSICRAIFLRLAGPGEGEGVVRRRVPLAEFDVERDGAMAGVIDVLTDARLLTTGDGYVEVAHEALLREWPRVQGWLADDAAGRELRLHLTDAARDWQQHGREVGDLYRGARLAAALEWAAEHEPELNASERDFLAASRAESEREIERQRRANRRLRVLLAGAGVFLLLAVAAGSFAAMQLQRAEDANLVARSHELAAYAVSFLEDDPALSKLLALSAATVIPNPPVETLSALHQAWAADRIAGRYEWPAEQPTANFWADIHPDGQYVVATQELGYVEVRDIGSGGVLWSHEFSDGMAVVRPTFAVDGDVVVAGVIVGADPSATTDSDRAGAYVWDVLTGEVLHYFELGTCGGAVMGASHSHLLVETFSDPAPGTCGEQLLPDTAFSLQLIDIATGEPTPLTAQTGFSAMSADGGRITYEDFAGDVPITIVMDVGSGERLMELDKRGLEQADTYPRDLNTDGSLLLYGDRPLFVFEVSSGEQVGAYGGHAGEAFEARFALDGETVFSAGRDGSLHHWPARGGPALAVYRGLGGGRPGIAQQGIVLVPDPDRGVAWLLDTALRGERGAVFTCPSTLVFAGSLKAEPATSVHAQECEGSYSTFVVDLEAQQVLRTIPDHQGQGLALSHDAIRIVRQSGSDMTVGPPEILDIATGSAMPLEGVCSYRLDVSAEPHEQPGCSAWPQPPFPLWNWHLQWSPDDRFVVAIDQLSGSFAVWDAASGVLLHAAEPQIGARDAIFTPDAAELIVSFQAPVRLRVLSTTTWQTVREVELADGDVSDLTFIGYSIEDSQLLAIGGYGGSGGGSLHWLDADTLEVSGRSIGRTHEGSPKSYALSPNGNLMVTGASDGYVRVWDVDRRSLVHEFRIGAEQVQGVAFVNDRHVMIAPQSGHLFVYTIDQQELIDIARRSLSRGFTELECDRFKFGDACPTLEEMRGD